MLKKPNILIIHADQLRHDCLGCTGNTDIKTPNIDSLAKDGVRYTGHYTVYPICTPSRYSLWSGMYVHQHTAWNNNSTLPQGIETFPSLLKKNGYKTTAVGKMHMNPTYQDIGFEKLILAEQNGKGRYEDDYHRMLLEQGEIDRVDLHDQSGEFQIKGMEDINDNFGAIPSDLPCELHSTSWTTKEALKELESFSADGGRLLMVGYIKPHHPFDPPKPYDEMYSPSSLTLLNGFTDNALDIDKQNNGLRLDYDRLSEEKLRNVMALYYGSITHIDDGIGEIIKLLKSKGLYDDTVIIFTSDHGDYMGYHHMLLKCNFLYEPLAKIPLIIKYPNGLKKGEDARLCENIDICPTVLELCGISPTESMEGISLLGENRRCFAFSEGQYGTDSSPCISYMLCEERYKLILHGSFERGMLFDLESDPNELENLFYDTNYCALVNRLSQKLSQKLLFDSPTKAYRDMNAPALHDSEKLNAQAQQLKAFISAKWE